MGELTRFLIAGGTTVGFYVGGVWLGTEVMSLPPRPVNIVFYILATTFSFILAYVWIFTSSANKKTALIRYLILQAFGVACNMLWVEAGLRFTAFYPWIIAAAYFAFWPFISFTVQRQYIFK